MKKAILWIIVILLIATGVGVAWSLIKRPSTTDDENILRTAEVIRGDLTVAVTASGNISIKDKAELYFSTPGKVEEIYVQVGEYVTQGTRLAKLDTTNSENIIRQSEINLEQAELNFETLKEPVEAEELELATLSVQNTSQALEVARINKQTAQADANALRVQAQRARENAFKDNQNAKGTSREKSTREAYEASLEEEQIAQLNADLLIQQAEEQWLSAYNRYQQALLNQKTLEQGADEIQIQQTELQVEQALLSLEQEKQALNDAILTAPFDGIIAAVNAKINVPPPSRQAAFVLIDNTAFYVDVSIDETDIGKVRIGQPVKIALDAYPDLVFDGEVERIAPAPSGMNGVIAYQLRVKLINTQDAQIRDGMTTSVQIQTDKVTDVLLVPNWAIRTDQRDNNTYTYCYCISNGSPQRIDITTGQRNESYTEITSGLEEGATIALLIEERNLFEFQGPPSRGTQ